MTMHIDHGNQSKREYINSMITKCDTISKLYALYDYNCNALQIPMSKRLDRPATEFERERYRREVARMLKGNALVGFPTDFKQRDIKQVHTAYIRICDQVHWPQHDRLDYSNGQHPALHEDNVGRFDVNPYGIDISEEMKESESVLTTRNEMSEGEMIMRGYSNGFPSNKEIRRMREEQNSLNRPTLVSEKVRAQWARERERVRQRRVLLIDRERERAEEIQRVKAVQKYERVDQKDGATLWRKYLVKEQDKQRSKVPLILECG